MSPTFCVTVSLVSSFNNVFSLQKSLIHLFLFTNLVDRFDKKIRYASRKARADVRKRVKGRFIKAGEAYDYDPLSQTRSY